jgi:translation elongation factor P/translation initiation factor 5A
MPFTFEKGSTLSGEPRVNEQVEILYVDGSKQSGQVIQSTNNGLLFMDGETILVIFVPWTSIRVLALTDR